MKKLSLLFFLLFSIANHAQEIKNKISATCPAVTLFNYSNPAFCVGTSPMLVPNLQGTGNYFGGQFSVQGSSGLLVDSNSGMILGAITSGQYVVNYTTPSTAGCPTSSISAFVNVFPSPENPVVNCGASTSNTIEFKWDPVAGALGYYLDFKGGYTQSQIGNGDNTSYTIKNAPITPVTITVNTHNQYGCYSKGTTTCSIVKNCPTIITTNGSSSCGPDSITLSATATDGAIINWYGSSTDTKIIGFGTSFKTPLISENTTYFVDATLNGCTSTPRVGVLANVINIPNLSILDSPKCNSNLNTYSFSYNSSGVVTSTVGTVDDVAKTITGIPLGVDTLLTSKLNGCTNTLNVASPNCSLNVNTEDWQHLIIYPNPATSYLTITNIIAIDSVEIFDIIGQSITYQSNSDTTFKLNVSELTSGVYYIKIMSNNKQKVSQFIKE